MWVLTKGEVENIVHNLRLCFVWRGRVLSSTCCLRTPATFSLTAQLLPTFCSVFGHFLINFCPLSVWFVATFSSLFGHFLLNFWPLSRQLLATMWSTLITSICFLVSFGVMGTFWWLAKFRSNCDNFLVLFCQFVRTFSNFWHMAMWSCSVWLLNAFSWPMTIFKSKFWSTCVSKQILVPDLHIWYIIHFESWFLSIHSFSYSLFITDVCIIWQLHILSSVYLSQLLSLGKS